MDAQVFLLFLAAISLLAFFLGRRQALFYGRAFQAGGQTGTRRQKKKSVKPARAERRSANIWGLHALPHHYGLLVFYLVLIPALGLYWVWNLAWPRLSSVWLSWRLERYLEDEGVSGGQEALVKSALKAGAALREPAGQLEALQRALGGLSSHFSLESLQPLMEELRRFTRFAEGDIYWLFLALAVALGAWAYWRFHPEDSAQEGVERWNSALMLAAASLATLITLGMFLALFGETLAFFRKYPWEDFFFGLRWSPQVAIHDEQVTQGGAFGIVPLIVGTLLIATIAMAVAVPLGLLSAIYLGEYAGTRMRAILKPVLEILAGIPTVVYGIFAALTLAPVIRDTASLLGLSTRTDIALAAGSVMGFMILPFVASMSDDAIHAVPKSLHDGARALGATRSEALLKVILPAALPGIAGGILLAVSRAIGETMIVVMAAGLAAKLSFNPLDSVTTVTVQINANLTGDVDFASPKVLSAFALALTLFMGTLLLNSLALFVVRRFKESYD